MYFMCHLRHGRSRTLSNPCSLIALHMERLSLVKELSLAISSMALSSTEEHPFKHNELSCFKWSINLRPSKSSCLQFVRSTHLIWDEFARHIKASFLRLKQFLRLTVCRLIRLDSAWNPDSDRAQQLVKFMWARCSQFILFKACSHSSSTSRHFDNDIFEISLPASVSKISLFITLFSTNELIIDSISSGGTPGGNFSCLMTTKHIARVQLSFNESGRYLPPRSSKWSLFLYWSYPAVCSEGTAEYSCIKILLCEWLGSPRCNWLELQTPISASLKTGP